MKWNTVSLSRQRDDVDAEHLSERRPKRTFALYLSLGRSRFRYPVSVLSSWFNGPGLHIGLMIVGQVASARAVPFAPFGRFSECVLDLFSSNSC